jgi:hypothetical protein
MQNKVLVRFVIAVAVNAKFFKVVTLEPRYFAVPKSRAARGRFVAQSSPGSIRRAESAGNSSSWLLCMGLFSMF